MPISYGKSIVGTSGINGDAWYYQYNEPILRESNYED